VKKFLTTIILIGGLTMGGATYADNLKSTDTSLEETLRLMEESVVELTEDAKEKVFLQNENVEKRFVKVEEVVKYGEEEEIIEVIEDFNRNTEILENILVEAELDEEEFTELEEVITNISKKRTQNLLALLERENLPEQAKAGIRKAIANQERAMLRAAGAKKRGKQWVEENDEEVMEDSTVESNEDIEKQSDMERANNKKEKTLSKAAVKVQKAEERAKRAQEKGQVKAHEKAQEKMERTLQKAQNKVEKVDRKNERGTSIGRP
jgi:hypothetical protein